MKHIHRLLSALTLIAIIAALALQGVPQALAASPADEPAISRCTPITPADMAAGAAAGSGQNLWQPVAGTPPPARPGAQPAVNPVFFHSYTLYRDGMAALLATAPSEGSEAARENPLVLSLPNPCGDFERFAVEESPIMEPGLAAKHPEINTYRGRGIDDPAATIRFDLTPLGFHASVRSPYGAWYIDPFYHLDDSLYVTYFGRDLGEDPHGGFGEQEADAFELLLDQVDDDSTTFPPTGDVLRTYRLALITDPGYATYFGGSPNVTAAKVTLINRVTQIYEDDLSIRLLLVNNNDLLNLDTYAQAVGPNGPCGAAGCFTQSQVTGCSGLTRNRIVIGQIIGASNYDIGHLALGQPGGGVANLGVVGRAKQGRRLHRHPDAGRRLLRRGLRGARDGPPVQRQSHLQRQPTQLLRRQPQRVYFGRTWQRLLGHGLCGHLPHGRPPGLTAIRTSRSGASRRYRPTRPRPLPRSTRYRRPRCGTSAAATKSRS